MFEVHNALQSWYDLRPMSYRYDNVFMFTFYCYIYKALFLYDYKIPVCDVWYPSRCYRMIFDIQSTIYEMLLSGKVYRLIVVILMHWYCLV
jgi:hypothetical protein